MENVVGLEGVALAEVRRSAPALHPQTGARKHPTAELFHLIELSVAIETIDS